MSPKSGITRRDEIDESRGIDEDGDGVDGVDDEDDDEDDEEDDEDDEDRGGMQDKKSGSSES